MIDSKYLKLKLFYRGHTGARNHTSTIKEKIFGWGSGWTRDCRYTEN